MINLKYRHNEFQWSLSGPQTHLAFNEVPLAAFLLYTMCRRSSQKKYQARACLCDFEIYIFLSLARQACMQDTVNANEYVYLYLVLFYSSSSFERFYVIIHANYAAAGAVLVPVDAPPLPRPPRPLKVPRPRPPPAFIGILFLPCVCISLTRTPSLF